MLIIDEITIALCIIVILLAIMASLINPLLHRISVVDNEYVADQLPPISILIPEHDNAKELDQNLALFLNQKYPIDYQIIVITEEGHGDTEDVLKKYSNNSHLYTTYIPQSSRYMSRKKLQITLGVKAAKHEWILLTDPSCKPLNENWLATMASKCNNQTNIVLGYTTLEEGTNEYRRFEHINTAHYILNQANRGQAYITNMQNLMFRKSEFLQKGGFLGNLDQIRGEYYFLVNKFSEDSKTKIITDRDSWLEEQEPSDKEWNNRHLYYLAARKDLKRSKKIHYKMLVNEIIPHLSILTSLGIIVYSVNSQKWLLTACSILSIVILFFARSIIASKAIKPFYGDLAIWKIPFYELSLIWHRIYYHISYMKADKRDFTTHKL
ncbi:glycosyltransferase [Segatella bryantii]|jgi:hypothetical protein|uniref:Glycosyltransferase 2-like domain-containing protein n=1 Tax=Segatella bryantii TaxID=77095 RepID=A0ABX4EEQ1_SEGBR|nr:glycosyltransferase [Segatella bryantii]MBQ3858185.1 glycosyltransferase [Prevotella sp.]MDR4932113.1 glycosyltransferase [Segatella bryantii]MEE3414901.1 glycosyltransferase [Prevotella sp.]OYP53560.1 hypothetical protein CIK91_13015 [Segatella bryantii]UKK73837.1 glycosyltransferase [Segatella bryantii]